MARKIEYYGRGWLNHDPGFLMQVFITNNLELKNSNFWCHGMKIQKIKHAQQLLKLSHSLFPEVLSAAPKRRKTCWKVSQV